MLDELALARLLVRIYVDYDSNHMADFGYYLCLNHLRMYHYQLFLYNQPSYLHFIAHVVTSFLCRPTLCSTQCECV